MKASSVILDALKDIDNTGTLEAEKKMTLHAGQDIRMTTGTHREENGQGHTTAILFQKEALHPSQEKKAASP